MLRGRGGQGEVNEGGKGDICNIICNTLTIQKKSCVSQVCVIPKTDEMQENARGF